jgi:peptidoglycan biosynthesis protein MviN/MurJ (putative lipid II flippase)
MIFLLAKKISVEQIVQARWILIIYCMGLVFFCFNKILLSLFYSLKDTRSTTISSGVGAAINGIGDVISLYYGSIYGIAASAVIAGAGSSLISCYFLWKKHGVCFYLSRYVSFFVSFFSQLLCCGAIFVSLFYLLYTSALYGYCAVILGNVLVYWALIALCSACVAVLWYTTRPVFKVHLYFLK